MRLHMGATDTAVSAISCVDGWGINYTRVERIWRQEGLKAPKKTAQKEKIVVKWRFLHTLASVLGKSRLGLQFRAGQNA